MIFISENIINEQLDTYDTSETSLSVDFNDMIDNHSPIMSYFQQESFDLLTEDEKALLEFMFTVIYSSVAKALKGPVDFQIQTMEEEEEKNWDIFNHHSSKKFSHICDVFFEDYAQEDLLAFVEDTTQLDSEDNVLTPVGREILFISCKSLIDTLDKNNHS
jgi:hypothetical protein